MAHDRNETNQDVARKAWAQPELRRLQAGAAEGATGDQVDFSSPQES